MPPELRHGLLKLPMLVCDGAAHWLIRDGLCLLLQTDHANHLLVQRPSQCWWAAP